MIEVSVVLPVYNEAGRIQKTIASVVRQQEVDLELIVVDDCSDDGSGSLPNGYDDVRIRSISLSRRSGVSAARNAGVAAARGEYVTFIDAGDAYLPGGLATLLGAKGEDLVVAGFHLDINDDLRSMGAMGAAPFSDGILNLSADRGHYSAASLPNLVNVLLDNDLLHPVGNKLYRLESARRTRFDESVFHALEDELFNLKFLECARHIAVIPDPVQRVDTSDPRSLSLHGDDDRIFNLRKLAEAYDSLLSHMGCSENSETALNCGRQLLMHYMGALANLRRMSGFARPTAILYEMDRLLGDIRFTQIADRLGLRRELLVSTMNAVSDWVLPLLRRESFIWREHGNRLQCMAGILMASRFHQKDRARSLADAAPRHGVDNEDAVILAERLWSEFNV